MSRTVVVRLNNSAGTAWTIREVRDIVVKEEVLFIRNIDSRMSFPLRNVLWWKETEEVDAKV